MKQIYVAGSYTAESIEKIEQNVDRAVACCVELMRHDAYPRCPHILGYATYDEVDKPWEWWMQATGEDLARCDAVLVIPFSDDSKGTQIEIRIAREIGLPVFFAIQDDSSETFRVELSEKMREWLRK